MHTISQFDDVWPNQLSGKGMIDCGDRRMEIKLTVDGTALDTAKQNLKLILENWSTLWPRILDTAQPMFDGQLQYNDFTPLDIYYPSASLEITIPSDMSSKYFEWNIGIKHTCATRCRYFYCNVVINNWTPDPVKSRIRSV